MRVRAKELRRTRKRSEERHKARHKADIKTSDSPQAQIAARATGEPADGNLRTGTAAGSASR